MKKKRIKNAEIFLKKKSAKNNRKKISLKVTLLTPWSGTPNGKMVHIRLSLSPETLESDTNSRH